MERDAKRMRGTRPFVMTNLRLGQGLEDIVRFIKDKGALESHDSRRRFEDERLDRHRFRGL